MKLNLDFSLYKGITLLRVWWKEVKKHFEEVQKAYNALDDTVTQDKEELLSRLGDETAQRKQADIELEEKLSSKISDEAQQRADADDALTEQIRAAKADFLSRINAEATARSTEDTRLDGEIEQLKAASHTHTNFEILEDITAEDMDKWNRSAEEKIENTEFLKYLDDVCADMSRKIGELYTLSGMEVYDGGLYGEMYEGASLDGGDDEDIDAERIVVDFGGFDNNMPHTVTIDGGNY